MERFSPPTPCARIGRKHCPAGFLPILAERLRGENLVATTDTGIVCDDGKFSLDFPVPVIVN
jgi:hypothetical protein